MLIKRIIFIFILLTSFHLYSSDEISAVKPDLTMDKEQQRASFIGVWESSQPTREGGKRHTLMTRLADSRYVVEFKIYDSESQLKIEQKEFGFWGVAGGIYFTMYRGSVKDDEFFPVDPNNAYYYDAYQITEIATDRLVYKSLSSENIFTYKRVK